MSDIITYYPLSQPQKGIWYTEKLYPETSIGNIAATLKINEEIDFDILGKAINQFIRMNDSMRMHFVEKDGEPQQYVTDFINKEFELLDFSGHEIEELYSWDKKITQTPFFKMDADLFYFALVKMKDGMGGFYVKLHHLIGDAWTLVNLGNEIMENYKRINEGIEIANESKHSYIEYILNEEKYMKSERFLKDEEYWKEKFIDIPELTTIKERISNKINSNASRKTFVLPVKLSEKIRKHCDEHKTSIFSLFLGSMAIYINRIMGKQDLVFGTPVLNRSNIKEKETMGMFVSTVPIRVKVDDELDYTSFAKIISKEWMTILRHQKYPYTMLLKNIREKQKGIDKLYDIVISYQNAKVNKKNTAIEQEGRWHFNGYQTESLYVHINDREDDGKIILDYDFLSNLYYTKEIEYIHDHIIRLLWHALDNPTRKLSKIEMISEIEKNKILYEFNNTEAEYPRDKTVHQLFEEQVEKAPNNTALVFESKKMSYKELNEKANQLARELRERGVKPDEIVGVMLQRSFEMLISIFAVIKAGGAYLPIDPEYPQDRIKFMLKDSNAKILLTHMDLSSELEYGELEYDGQIIDVKSAEIKDRDTCNLSIVNKPSDLIYVIYTSGSTGEPKGVMIEHRNVVRLLFNEKFQFSFSDMDIWTMFHSFCFDFSVWEMYGALLNGGKLVIITKHESMDTNNFLAILIKEKVTVLNQTPAAFYNLIEEEKKDIRTQLSLRYVIFGGDALKPSKLNSFKKKYSETKLINMYGITETTVHVTFMEITEKEIDSNICNIGKPIPTLMAYIVDKNLNLLPIGVPGELCVSGEGVGRGYLNNEKLTKQKFVKSFFSEGKIMYRSGDLARFFPKGEIEYLGRIDNQVKIRGHRIEIGEIETTILKFQYIKEVKVIAKDNKFGNKQLYAFYVSSIDFEMDKLRKFLLKYIPIYMMPSFFIKIEKIPLTRNGKIDIKSLNQANDVALREDKYAAPKSEIQELLTNVWSQVLEIKDIGINDNFFHIGGDSLSAISIVSKIGREVTLSDIYNNPTIEMLSELIENKKASKHKYLIKMTKKITKAKKSIICFPYGGGNAFVFNDLADSITKLNVDYDLYSVNLPGHDIGSLEEFLPNSEMARHLLHEIKDVIEGDIIIYSHCVGSALAIETAKLIEEQGEIKIEGIYVGGILPPERNWVFGEQYDPWKLFSDRKIISFLNIIGLPKFDIKSEYQNTMIKSFRHDVKSFYSYFYNFNINGNEKLKTPIYSIIGDKDLITLNYMKKFKNWNKYTNTEIKLYKIEGGDHYFIKSNPNKLAIILTNMIEF